MRNDVEIGDERRLEDDGNVGGVEQLDRIGAVLAAVAHRFDWQIHAETCNFRKLNALLKITAR